MVDRASIDEMARIMAAMNGGPAPAPRAAAASSPNSRNNIGPITAEIDQNASIAAMKKIMETFAASTGTAPAAAPASAPVREAMNTAQTATGTRVGAWEIVIHEGAPRTYDVKNVVTGDIIARDLYLYEACVGLVRKLNEGVGINDRKIRELLSLEEQYARNRDDASQYKRTAKRALSEGNYQKAAISEDRYDGAQEKAISAQERLMILAGLRR